MNCLSPSILSADYGKLAEEIQRIDEAGHNIFILMLWMVCLYPTLH